ncbi:MAG: hypothetical protein K6F99_05115, partial [Lachnospiraceae bacterium]|nr:hypothetical protein [Lachnospiraceae bacterium]
VFTKSQVVRMKVGSFSYNKKKDKTEEEKDNKKETQNDDKAGEAKVDSTVTVTVKEETSENKELNTEKEDNNA